MKNKNEYLKKQVDKQDKLISRSVSITQNQHEELNSQGLNLSKLIRDFLEDFLKVKPKK